MSENNLNNYYVKTESAKFYLTNIKIVDHFDETHWFFDENNSPVLGIPQIGLKFFFVCNQNKYNTLPTDLKRGVIHL